MDDVEAVEEILAEAPLGHELLEFRIGRGNHADVDFHRLRLAEWMNLVCFEEPEQLGLDVERHVGNLVEEQRPAPPPIG
jgi:hypothetical protein